MNLKKNKNLCLIKIKNAKNLDDLKNIYSFCLGKKSFFKKIFKKTKFQKLSTKKKIEIGKKINVLKKRIQSLFNEKQKKIIFYKINKNKLNKKIDIFLPEIKFSLGFRNPLIYVLRKIENFFINKLNYDFFDGEEIESEYYNFKRANIPKNHPAREEHDSFFIDKNKKKLLRSHTTASQMRILEMFSPNKNIKIITSGNVYRRDEDDSLHSHQFTQLEGIVVNNKSPSLYDLKKTLILLIEYLFGNNIKIRFRISHFQFTVPSIELDIKCFQCKNNNKNKKYLCVFCKNKKWIEILGGGLIHKKVLYYAKYNKNFKGFAFGLGIERIAMLKFGINDVRSFYINDKKFLEKFNINF